MDMVRGMLPTDKPESKPTSPELFARVELQNIGMLGITRVLEMSDNGKYDDNKAVAALLRKMADSVEQGSINKPEQAGQARCGVNAPLCRSKRGQSCESKEPCQFKTNKEETHE